VVVTEAQSSEGSEDERILPDRFLGDETMATASEIAAVGVIGAGQMGSGIAQLAAAVGCAVLLLDADSAALSRAVASISSSLRHIAAKGHLSQVSALTSQSTLPKSAAFRFLLHKSLCLLGLQAACENSIRRIRCVSAVQDLRDADLVIEAIVENEDVKKKLFVELDKITKPSTILASNTSSISITRLASATKRPSQVMSDPALSAHAKSLNSVFKVVKLATYCR
jgi:3-hydroxybutyryl-CoA dehydrogenase